MVGATVIGLGIGAVAIVGDGGGDDASPTTSGALADLASSITTPATLRPLDTLPRPDDPALTGEPFSEGPQSTTSQDRTLFEGVTVPSYPEVPDAGLAELVSYDIAAAVDLLADDVHRRSDTHLELGTAGFVLDVSIERDPELDRYRVILESRGDSQVAIVDVATDTTYINIGTDNRVEVPNAEIIDGSGAADINEYFDRLLLGPLRPDTYNPASTRGRSLVTLDSGAVARHFITSIRGELIPEWQLYAFSPVFEFPVEDRPSLLEYHVYVTEAGDIAQVDGVSQVGDVPQLVLHRLTVLDERNVIELTEPGSLPR